MHDHLGHLNLVADKAIFADSWNEGGQKPSNDTTADPKQFVFFNIGTLCN